MLSRLLKYLFPVSENEYHFSDSTFSLKLSYTDKERLAFYSC